MSASAARDPWFPFVAANGPAAAAPVRLFCFPFAGAGASVFREWPAELPSSVGVFAVQPPGHETRIRETPLVSVESLVDAFLPALLPRLDRPFAFFGHSLGALVAYELARALRSRGAPLPGRLFVSGSRAPHRPKRAGLYHVLEGDAFVAGLRRLGGTPERVLAEPELMELFEPMLRADFTMSETYERAPDDPLDVPIAAFGGTDDPEVEPGGLEAWEEHTRAPFTLERFPGDHFFLQSARTELLRAVALELSRP